MFVCVCVCMTCSRLFKANSKFFKGHEVGCVCVCSCSCVCLCVCVCVTSVYCQMILGWSHIDAEQIISPMKIWTQCLVDARVLFGGGILGCITGRIGPCEILSVTSCHVHDNDGPGIMIRLFALLSSLLFRNSNI